MPSLVGPRSKMRIIFLALPRKPYCEKCAFVSGWLVVLPDLHCVTFAPCAEGEQPTQT